MDKVLWQEDEWEIVMYEVRWEVQMRADEVSWIDLEDSFEEVVEDDKEEEWDFEKVDEDDRVVLVKVVEDECEEEEASRKASFFVLLTFCYKFL